MIFLSKVEKKKKQWSLIHQSFILHLVRAIVQRRNFMPVYLCAPVVSLRPPLGVGARALVKFFHNRPDNAFQVCVYPIGYFHMVRIDETIFTMKCQYLPIMFLIFFARLLYGTSYQFLSCKKLLHLWYVQLVDLCFIFSFQFVVANCYTC